METKQLAVSFAAVLASVAAQAFTLASPETQARIVVAAGEPECVLLTARDLASDVKKITGLTLEVLTGAEPRRGDVSLRTVAGAWESYAVSERDGVLEFRGGDARGTMFAVYDFIENYLGVDPMYFWSGVPHPQAKTLAWETVRITRGSPAFKFRGWFLNDEDLLTKWRGRSGERNYLVYPYYHDVMMPSVAEDVAEALVRSRFNMIIPDSFVNISNPPEAALLAIYARRGVFLTMHHIEPMGTSGFAFKDYWKQRGRELPYSYSSHPEEVAEVWRHQAAQWAKFPNVVWQLGLRGATDVPLWNSDKSVPEDDASRARLISNAMARQVAILDALGIAKERRFTTTTLWAEGAYFFAKGLLTVPEGTTIVFADNNGGWRWQDDFRQVPRDTSRYAYGVYYHHQLIGPGPHVASFVPPARTHAMLAEARAKSTGTYAIFNVGNVREFVCGIGATAAMTWDTDGFDAERWMRDWLKRRVPTHAADWMTVMNIRANAMQIHPDLGVPMYMDGQTTWEMKGAVKRMMRVLNGKAKPAIRAEPATKKCREKVSADPFWKALRDVHPLSASDRDTAQRLAAQREAYDQALRLGRILLARSPEGERAFAYDQLVYPALVMRELADSAVCALRAEEALGAGDRAAALAEAKASLAAQERINAAARDYCHGAQWADWYRGCEKINFREFTKMLAALVARLERSR